VREQQPVHQEVQQASKMTLHPTLLHLLLISGEKSFGMLSQVCSSRFHRRCRLRRVSFARVSCLPQARSSKRAHQRVKMMLPKMAALRCQPPRLAPTHKLWEVTTL
jgi:hypothetical protein